MTEFVTYVGELSRVAPLIEAGADHLILEDPKLSVRSYVAQRDFGFGNVAAMAERARQCRADIGLSFNLDLLAHERHFALIRQLVEVLNDCGVDVLRVQDPGLIDFVRKIMPEAKFHLALETGNNNEGSWRYFAGCEGVVRQVLSNEATESVIAHAVERIGCEWEFQVHGPILLQFTDRRLMAGHEAAEAGPGELPPIMQRLARDYRNKVFPFYDNEHGHFMYHSSDKCLLKLMDRLVGLNLHAWLFDGRGESLAYIVDALGVYRRLEQEMAEGGDRPWVLASDELEFLKKGARRPFHPAFFKANNTDRFDDEALDARETRKVSGRVIDIIRERWMTIDLQRPLALGDKVRVETPDGRRKSFEVSRLCDMSGGDIVSAGGGLVKLRWLGGVVAQTILLHE